MIVRGIDLFVWFIWLGESFFGEVIFKLRFSWWLGVIRWRDGISIVGRVSSKGEVFSYIWEELREV